VLLFFVEKVNSAQRQTCYSMLKTVETHSFDSAESRRVLFYFIL